MFISQFSYLKQSFSAWNKDHVPMLAAALSYYTVFAIGPLLLLIISIVGFFFGKSAVEGEVVSQLSGLLGRDTARTIETIVEGSRDPEAGVVSFIIGTVLLLISASGVFSQLKMALNQIWSIEPKPGRGAMGVIQERFLSFAMIGVIAFLLGVSLLATSAVSVLGSYFSSFLPAPEWVIQALNIFISFWIILVLFALVYRVLPDVKPDWKLVWGGATLAALLFTGGKTLIGVYIGNSVAASTYGAASSLVVLLVWVYYSSLIFLYGAEYVKVSALVHGETVEVEKYAVKTKTIRARGETEQLSVIEQYVAQLVGQLLGSTVEKIDKKYIRPKKTFWQRVQERLEEDKCTPFFLKI
jgi:membrane protein